MHTPRIHDRGRGPEIEGTRITVYDVMDYYLDGWPAGRIANWLAQRVDDIRAAIDYIEAHRAELEPKYRRMVERAERGNSPEIRALMEARRPIVQAKMAEMVRKARERKEAEKNGGTQNGSHS